MTTPSVTRRTSWIKTIGRRSRTCSKSLRPLSVSRLSGMRSRRPSFATRSRDSPALPTTWRRPSWFKEQALAAAEARLAELEEQPAEARPANGGFFDSLFGDRREPQRSSGSVPRTGTATREPMQGQHPGGGGFLAGAAQTALGVTGGGARQRHRGHALAVVRPRPQNRRRTKAGTIKTPKIKAPNSPKTTTRIRRRPSTRSAATISATSTWTSKPR